MATFGEILRWIGINFEALRKWLFRIYLRVVARLLRRDQLVARTERKFRALLESAPDAVVIVDWHGHIKLINAQAEKLFGWPRAEIVGQNVSELIPKSLRSAHREHLKRYLQTASPRPMGMGHNDELYGLRKDGSVFPVEISLGPLQTDEGLLVSAAVRDITDRKLAEAALREAEECFRTAFEEAPVGMALVALDGRIVHVNRSMCEITGHSPEQLEATTLASITHPDDITANDDEIQRLIDREIDHYRAECRYLHAAGDPVPVDLSAAVIRGAGGEPRNFLIQVHDITERKRFEGQLQHLADHDALTGMFNRRRFEHELDRELARAARYRTGGALLAIDLDHFKDVNDTFGHSVGDALIARVGEIFRATLRDTDIMARLGGDEFAVILPGADERRAAAVAEKLLGLLRAEGRVGPAGDRPARVTATLGIALFGDAPLTAEELLVEADIAMYVAKEAGRDRLEVYNAATSRPDRMRRPPHLVDHIRDALENDRFVLHAQPIQSLVGDPVPRLELLIRMLGEGDDLVPPGTFLYTGERFDLIQAIDRWVIRRAIALLAAHKRVGCPIHISLNLSAKSVTDPGLPSFVTAELQSAGIDGHGLCVEVTETAAIVNVDRAKLFAHTLADLGCEFALDDFGAGFASFYYLEHMAFDYVKIDGEFIRNLPASPVNQLVVRSVVDIARGLGKRTVAEFVGDQETEDLLRRYGVDYAQGFHVAKPQPLELLDLSHPIGAVEIARSSLQPSINGGGSRNA